MHVRTPSAPVPALEGDPHETEQLLKGPWEPASPSKRPRRSILRKDDSDDAAEKDKKAVTFSHCTMDFELRPKPKTFFPLGFATAKSSTVLGFNPSLTTVPPAAPSPSPLSFRPPPKAGEASPPIEDPLSSSVISELETPERALQLDTPEALSSIGGVNTFFLNGEFRQPLARGIQLEEAKGSKQNPIALPPPDLPPAPFGGFGPETPQAEHSSPRVLRDGRVLRENSADGEEKSPIATAASLGGSPQIYEVAQGHTMESILDRFYLST